MNKLRAKDLILLSRIAKKIGLNNILPTIEDLTGLSDLQKLIKQKQQGIKMVIAIIENIHLAEKEIFELISIVSGKEIELCFEMSFKELKDNLTFALDDEGIVSFFS